MLRFHSAPHVKVGTCTLYSAGLYVTRAVACLTLPLPFHLHLHLPITLVARSSYKNSFQLKEMWTICILSESITFEIWHGIFFLRNFPFWCKKQSQIGSNKNFHSKIAQWIEYTFNFLGTIVVNEILWRKHSNDHSWVEWFYGGETVIKYFKKCKKIRTKTICTNITIFSSCCAKCTRKCNERKIWKNCNPFHSAITCLTSSAKYMTRGIFIRPKFDCIVCIWMSSRQKFSLKKTVKFNNSYFHGIVED